MENLSRRGSLDEVREEVLLGRGVFSEDEQLRHLLQECFEDGDSLNGVVYWSECPNDLQEDHELR